MNAEHSFHLYSWEKGKWKLEAGRLQAPPLSYTLYIRILYILGPKHSGRAREVGEIGKYPGSRAFIAQAGDVERSECPLHE
jgi:hypothetical protein